MIRVIFDTNVLLDVLAERRNFYIASAQALDTATKLQVQGYIAGHAVTTLYYLLSRQVGKRPARRHLSRLLQRLQVASVTGEVIEAALQGPIKDFEDAVVSEAANAAGVEVIVTRNISDFVASAIPAVLPEEFLKMPLK
ncbi:MAG: PIN domain-containing protein [Elainellaceae cyanobacterium]